MKLKECIGKLKRYTTYDIGFINDKGMEDETEFDLEKNPEKELEECWNEFCKENGFNVNSVLYVEEA